MRLILLLCLPLFVLAQSYGLKQFVDNANKTNGLIEAKKLNVKSKAQEVEAARSAYWPTVDIGADYSFQSPNYIVSPGQVGNAFISANLNLYDGAEKMPSPRAKGLNTRHLFLKRLHLRRVSRLRLHVTTTAYRVSKPH